MVVKWPPWVRYGAAPAHVIFLLRVEVFDSKHDFVLPRAELVRVGFLATYNPTPIFQGEPNPTQRC